MTIMIGVLAHMGITFLLASVRPSHPITVGAQLMPATAATTLAAAAGSELESPQQQQLLEQPRVQCGESRIRVSLKTRAPFGGNVYAKGYFSREECRVRGNGVGTTANITIPVTADCGMRRRRVAGSPRGLVIEITVVLMLHPKFLTRHDRAFHIQCLYTEVEQRVTQRLDVSAPPSSELGLEAVTQAGSKTETPLPTCRYELLSGDGPSSATLQNFATLGQPIYHHWVCQPVSPPPSSTQLAPATSARTTSPPSLQLHQQQQTQQPQAGQHLSEGASVEEEEERLYCLTVHSCEVDDGQGNVQKLLDARGCPFDASLLGAIDYQGDLEAGRRAFAFKFADRPTVYFSCQLRLEVKGEWREKCKRSSDNCTDHSSSSSSSSTPEGEKAKKIEGRGSGIQPSPPPLPPQASAIINSQPELGGTASSLEAANEEERVDAKGAQPQLPSHLRTPFTASSNELTPSPPTITVTAQPPPAKPYQNSAQQQVPPAGGGGGVIISPIPGNAAEAAAAEEEGEAEKGGGAEDGEEKSAEAPDNDDQEQNGGEHSHSHHSHRKAPRLVNGRGRAVEFLAPIHPSGQLDLSPSLEGNGGVDDGIKHFPTRLARPDKSHHHRRGGGGDEDDEEHDNGAEVTDAAEMRGLLHEDDDDEEEEHLAPVANRPATRVFFTTTASSHTTLEPLPSGESRRRSSSSSSPTSTFAPPFSVATLSIRRRTRSRRPPSPTPVPPPLPELHATSEKRLLPSLPVVATANNDEGESVGVHSPPLTNYPTQTGIRGGGESRWSSKSLPHVGLGRMEEKSSQSILGDSTHPLATGFDIDVAAPAVDVLDVRVPTDAPSKSITRPTKVGEVVGSRRVVGNSNATSTPSSALVESPEKEGSELGEEEKEVPRNARENMLADTHRFFVEGGTRLCIARRTVTLSIFIATLLLLVTVSILCCLLVRLPSSASAEPKSPSFQRLQPRRLSDEGVERRQHLSGGEGKKPHLHHRRLTIQHPHNYDGVGSLAATAAAAAGAKETHTERPTSATAQGYYGNHATGLGRCYS